MSIDGVRGDATEITVGQGVSLAKAISYRSIVGELCPGDEVLLNSTAVEKNLGTGGFHFVMANLSRFDPGEIGRGHIVKCRYTPVQQTVLAVEEEDNPSREALKSAQTLAGMPVVIGQLHSQLGPAAAAAKRLTHGRCRVAYVMTDSAALPIAFSRLVHELREKQIVDITITAGQAFGGEIEAVNVYTALLAAKAVAEADIAIVCPGPGNTGTGTAFGFSSIEQGEIVNAVNVLGGEAIAIARISFADPRPRHHGLSHHTLTALGRVALTKCNLVLPMMDQMRLFAVQEQIAHSGISYKHKVRVLDGKPGIVELQEKGVGMSSMGRGFEDDPEFFLSAAAAGGLAAEILKSR